MRELDKKQIDELYEKIKKDYINISPFINDSIEQIYYQAIISLDCAFVHLLSMPDLKELYYFDFEWDSLRSSCREFIRLHIDNKAAKNKLSFNEKIYINTIKEFNSLKNYNFIRNSLERGYLGKTTIIYDEQLKKIGCKDKWSKQELLARQNDKIKPFFNKKTFLHNGSSNKIISLFIKQYNDLPIIDSQNYNQNYRTIQALYSFMQQEFDDDCFIDCSLYSFSSFSLTEYKKVYSGVMVLAYNKLEHSFIDNIIPSVIWNKTDLYDFLTTITMLERDKVRFIVDTFLTYDADFHRKLLTIYQPIFDIGDNQVLISCTYTLFGYAIDKLTYMLNKNINSCLTTKNDQMTLSKIAHDKEKIMIQECIDIIQNPRFKLYNNIKYSSPKSKKSAAEFDIILLDKKNKIIFLIELKDLQKTDNEFEQIQNIEKKLDEFCKDRLLKQHIVESNLIDFCKKAFNLTLTNDEPYSVFSFIVSKNNLPTKETDVIIIDEYLLNKLFVDNNFNTKTILNSLKNKTILELDDKIGIKTTEISLSFMDYKLNQELLYL